MVGVIGLGAIGDGVSTVVLRAGLALVVCDVRPEAPDHFREEATVAGLSRPSWPAWSDVVVVAVVNDEQVLTVLSGPEGALAAAGPPTPPWSIVSTISAPCVQAVGAEAAALGSTDARLRGERWPGRGRRRGPGLHGGRRSCRHRAVEPVFDAFSSLVVPMGPFGTGLPPSWPAT